MYDYIKGVLEETSCKNNWVQSELIFDKACYL